MLRLVACPSRGPAGLPCPAGPRSSRRRSLSFFVTTPGASFSLKPTLISVGFSRVFSRHSCTKPEKVLALLPIIRQLRRHSLPTLMSVGMRGECRHARLWSGSTSAFVASARDASDSISSAAPRSARPRRPFGVRRPWYASGYFRLRPFATLPPKFLPPLSVKSLATKIILNRIIL